MSGYDLATQQSWGTYSLVPITKHPDIYFSKSLLLSEWSPPSPIHNNKKGGCTFFITSLASCSITSVVSWTTAVLFVPINVANMETFYCHWRMNCLYLLYLITLSKPWSASVPLLNTEKVIASKFSPCSLFLPNPLEQERERDLGLVWSPVF